MTVNRIMKIIIAAAVAIFLCSGNAFAQFAQPIPSDKDTSIVFEPSMDLRQQAGTKFDKTSYFGPNILFSDHGVALGIFYNYAITQDMYLATQLFIGGVHNTDEYELWDPEAYDYRVPNKVNRLYQMPVSAGLKYNLFSSFMSKKLQPYLSAGGGFDVIMATPYSKEFFSAFGDAMTYIRPLWYFGVGIDIASGRSAINFNMTYYHIPFGDKGLESIKNKPITNFGGVFLGLAYAFSLGE